MRLDQLNTPRSATIAKLNSTGVNRRRLMDLGILPGTKIAVKMVSPLGDPVAYRVRGAVVALRHIQAHEIEITIDDEEQPHGY
jgi:Fe2+ transport system protein FeoA